MAGSHTFEVETVFSAEEQAASGWRLRLLGVVTLLVGAAWLYGTWGPMYNWINRSMAFGQLKLVLDLTEPESADNGDSKPKGDLGSFMGLVQASPNKQKVDPQRAAETQVAMAFLVAETYAWLGVTTFVGLWLIMGAVAAVGPGITVRSMGKIGLMLVIVSILGAGAYTWHKWGWVETSMPDWVKPLGKGLLIAFAACLGAVLNKRRVGIHRIGCILTILAAGLSVFAVWGAVRWGNMPGDDVNLVLYAKVFLIQSNYGWLMILASWGAK